MNKKHGWVVQENGDGGFVDEDCGGYSDADHTGDTPNLISKAEVFSTRKQARESHFKLEEDLIRKVELDKNGKPVKVIPGR